MPVDKMTTVRRSCKYFISSQLQHFEAFISNCGYSEKSKKRTQGKIHHAGSKTLNIYVKKKIKLI